MFLSILEDKKNFPTRDIEGFFTEERGVDYSRNLQEYICKKDLSRNKTTKKNKIYFSSLPVQGMTHYFSISFPFFISNVYSFQLCTGHLLQILTHQGWTKTVHFPLPGPRDGVKLLTEERAMYLQMEIRLPYLKGSCCKLHVEMQPAA